MIAPRPYALSLACGLAASLLCGCSGSSGSQTIPPSVVAGFQGQDRQLLDTALKDAVAEGWVRDTTTFHQGLLSGGGYADEGIGRGRQIIHVGTAQAEIIQVQGRAFIHGNTAAMARIFVFPKKDRALLSNRWLSVPAIDPNFSTFVADVTLESDITDSLPVGKLTRRDTTIDGRDVAAITGRPPKKEHAPAGASETLYISTGLDPLPIRETSTAPDGSAGTTTFTRWGLPVTISAPAHSTRLSTIVPGF